MNRMGSRKTDLRWAVAAALVMLAVLAPSASAQFTCGNAEDRVAPYCLNTPGTPAPPPLPVPELNFENRTVDRGARRTDVLRRRTERFGASQWMVIYPHAPGFFVGVVLRAYDTRIIVEDVAYRAVHLHRDDSLDQGGRYDSESIGVRGLEAGKAYLVQVAGRSRLQRRAGARHLRLRRRLRAGPRRRHDR